MPCHRQHRQHRPANVQDLAIALQEEWNGIPQFYLGRLVRSMPRRIEAYLTNQGGFTRY